MPRDLNSTSVADRVAVLNARYRHHAATAVLEHALKDDDLGRVALVSSFGAERRMQEQSMEVLIAIARRFKMGNIQNEP